VQLIDHVQVGVGEFMKTSNQYSDSSKDRQANLEKVNKKGVTIVNSRTDQYAGHGRTQIPRALMQRSCVMAFS